MSERPRLNIGWRKRGVNVPPDAISQGIHDGFRRIPDPAYLRDPAIRGPYLNGYQCGFRSRKNPRRGDERHAWMGDAFLAMHEPRYPHYIPPVMG